MEIELKHSNGEAYDLKEERKSPEQFQYHLEVVN